MHDHNPDIFVFLDTRVSGESASKVIQALGFTNSFRVEAAGFSEGIWLCWFDNFIIDVLFCHFQFKLCRISAPSTSSSCLDSFVYASPNYCKHTRLWSYLRELNSQISEPWVILGDFNATLAPEDR
ncbi:hypothetical protein HRI_003218400 [Hibiscus trionum]|uniref:Endonuclease/exonuclease/phosphatase domain-containing protein n=1 Tax=Hibiscus trionum TaxID=183268 RepID=A0A9W7IHT4_HIBTR|nr:hypothetical protein HRI_003218400 [Hibiscus trionum]